MVDWTLVGQVAGIGFAVLFIVLGIIAIVVWLVGLVLTRRNSAKLKEQDAAAPTTNEEKA